MIQRKATQSGPRYEVRLRRPDGGEYSKTFRTIRDARRYEASERSAAASGSWVDPSAGRRAFGDWADEWLATSSHTWRPRTAEKHKMAIDSHWRPRFGRTPLKAISTADVQRAVNELAATHQSWSVRTYYGTLRGCLKFAVERELIVRSPCRSIKLPALPTNEKRVISVDELHQLADAVGPRWRCFIYLGGVLGLRFGEVAALMLRDVDLANAEVSISRTLVEIGGKVSFAPPKSRASARSIAVAAPMLGELAAHIEGRGLDRPDDLMFVNRIAEPVKRSPFRLHVLGPAVASLGLDGLTFHGLRHSAATQWVASGVDLRTVQAWLGHADPQLVLRLYAHASDRAGRHGAEVVAGAFWESR